MRVTSLLRPYVTTLVIGLGLGSAMMSTAATPSKQNTLEIRAAFEFTSLDPSRSGFVYSRMQIVETLVDVDTEGRLIPALATEWQVHSDGLIWDFTLRPQVTFHDHTPMTATAVVASLQQALAKHGALRNAPIVSITAVSEQKVRIQLERPFNPLGAVLANYANAILAPAAYQAADVVALIGTGPYQLSDYTPPHKLRVQRFEPYWGQKATIEYANYLTGHRSESRAIQASSGEADIVFGLDPASLPQLKRSPNIHIHSHAIPRTILLKLNSGHAFLADPVAREALSLAIDRRGIANAILRTPGAEAQQILPAAFSAWHLPNVHAPENALALAAQQLASLGWKKNANKLLEKDGQVFKLRLITYADRPELTTVATAIQAQWAKLGVQLAVDVTNSSAIPAGHQDGSLEVALIARNYGFIADPLGVLLADFGNESGGDWGAMNWFHPEMSQRLFTLSQTTDPQVYQTLAQESASILYREKPMIPVTFYTQQTAVNTRVKGFRFDPFERSFFLNELEWQP